MLERIWGPVLAGQDWLSGGFVVPVLARKKRAAITNSVPNGTIGVKIDQATMFDSQAKAMYTFHGRV
jgi:hypothetical protein